MTPYKNIKTFFLFLFLKLMTLILNAQSDTIGIIDFYGASKFNIAELEKKITIKEGDPLDKINKEQIVKDLQTIPGVQQVELITVCCEDHGRSILFIGVSDIKKGINLYHKDPMSPISLPKEIIDTTERFYELMIEGIMKGESGEDRSAGHSLMNYTPARAIQEKFIVYAEKYLSLLKNVLKNSSHNEQRAIAAQILSYAKDKNSVIDDLLYAVNDNSEEVRNNATRALALIASYSENNPSLKIKKIPVEPFTKMMNSIIWTDRNKGSAVLLSLTEKRDTLILNKIKKQALVSIIDMAKWKNPGHAFMGYLLLGRIAGYTDVEINREFENNKESFLEQMLIATLPH